MHKQRRPAKCGSYPGLAVFWIMINLASGRKQNVNELISLAREEKDYQSEPLLAWFAKEQIEEEATSSKIADEVAMVGEDKSGLLLLDRELGSRAFPTGSPLDPAVYNLKE